MWSIQYHTVATGDIIGCNVRGSHSVKYKGNWHPLPFSTTRGSPLQRGPLFSTESICSGTYTLMWRATERVKFSIRLSASHTSRTASVQQIYSQLRFHCWRKLNCIPHRCKKETHVYLTISAHFTQHDTYENKEGEMNTYSSHSMYIQVHAPANPDR